MTIIRILIIGPLLLMAGCAIGSQPPEQARIFRGDDSGYTVTIPALLSRWTTVAKGMEGSNHPHFTTSIGEPEKIEMTIFGSTSPCSPSFLGTSAPVVDRNDEDGVLVWGEVDERNDGTFAEPHCRVKSVYPEKNPRESMTGYGLCAEKDGRSVLICISQVTDDPKLAEKIFETFRWVEE